MSAVEDRELIRKVVRGERPWTDLRTIGIDIQLDGNHCRIENLRHSDAHVQISDIARGLLTHLANPNDLRVWAQVLEASGFIDFDPDEHPAGEEVCSAVWDASFGLPVTDSAVRIARQIVEEAPTLVKREP